MADTSNISEQDKTLFRNSVGKIDRIQHDGIEFRRPANSRISLRHTAANRPKDHSDIEQTLSDVPDSTTDLGVGDELNFRRAGLQQKMFRKLRRGQFPVEATADLHGENIVQAKKSLIDFLRTCHNRNIRCVLIIHGKGYGSVNQKPVIKNKVNHWLREFKDVLAFCSARPDDGGTGAVYVLLRNSN